ncbi:hypothetical protein Vafri_6412 [Volvox africanus]|uniref:Uncharacterized protein n=1 Tax=Volvox africanus TaxID=51714 RepID=A0A8J4EWN6_9CHLO|nr:hypothetical protein Vafri_6412 [Volvox africanus]
MAEGFALAGFSAVVAVVVTVGTNWRQWTPHLRLATPPRTLVAAGLTVEVHPRSCSDCLALLAIDLVTGYLHVPVAAVAGVSLTVVPVVAVVYAAEAVLPEGAGLCEYGFGGTGSGSHTGGVARTQLERSTGSRTVRLLQM